MQYFVYIVSCSDGSLYTGYTNDLERRVRAHNESKSGAKYTKTRRPVQLVYSERFPTKSEAMKREHAIKKLSHEEKAILCR